VQLKTEERIVPAGNQGACLTFTPAAVAGAMIVDPIRREDHRGYFARKWCLREFAEQGIDFVPLQASIANNLHKGTVRGMHLQIAPALEAKLINCMKGSIFDVILDLRPESPTYLQWCGTILSAENQRMLYIPERCGHGYQTLEDDTNVFYLTSQYFAPASAKGARFDDPAFKIEWPLPPAVVSDADRNWPLVSEGLSL
jgi:dTDP-4-dehydrorhamnose 3,5-epimerase